MKYQNNPVIEWCICIGKYTITSTVTLYIFHSQIVRST